MSGEDLAGLLVNNGIKLAVFNSCRGGYSSSSKQGWQERNLAQALVNRGMPSVIAMAERIPDHVAITFTQLLYRNLKKGQSIDLSLNRTRQGLISAYGSHQFYWALPTLYMQPSFDGYLMKTAGDRENASLLDSANDPFGDIFSEPGLADIDWPVPRGQVSSRAIASGFEDASADLPTAGAVNRLSLVDNNDASDTEPMVKRPSTPSQPSAKRIDAAGNEIDGELRVPEEIKTSGGFYGESSSAGKTASSSTTLVDSRNPATDPSSVSSPARSSQGDDVPELVGERLTRSHTLHTKLLTVPGLASMALVLLLGIVTVGWFQRVGQLQARQPNVESPSSVDDLGLPARVEVALANGDLDAATTAAKELLETGEYEAALTALKSADSRQEKDAIVSFLKGRGQWGLTKQGSSEYSAADAMRSWTDSLESESDWMEIAMALGFAQYEVNREDLALESWQQAISLAEQKPDQYIYFSDQPVDEYLLNAYAGVAMASLALSRIETNPDERNRLLDEAKDAYLKVIDAAPADFNAQSLGENWLWLSPAISDWSTAKRELGSIVE